MSIAKFCFDGSLILPITPEAFEVSSGIRIETINIHAIGDIRIAGYPTLDSISISGIFPANRYSFAVTDDITPYALVAKFKEWAASRKVVRWLVTGSDVNMPVLIESISYGEKDGSGDVYYTLRMAEYCHVSASSGRSIDRYPKLPDVYTPEKGENLFIVADKVYGDKNKAKFIASANDMNNIYSRRNALRLPSIRQ